MHDLLTAADGRTTLVITHRTEGTEQADHWLWLDHGRSRAEPRPRRAAQSWSRGPSSSDRA